MGRVLSYSITKDGAFTKKEKVILHQHSFLYNSGEYENAWTCENFWLSPYAYYPNWKSYGGKVNSWEEVEARRVVLEQQFSHIQDEGTRDAEVIELLYKEKMIRYHHNDKSKVSGFTKVQGNEFNAALVYMVLVELSQKLPKCVINLSDEGEYLLCAVKIKNGKAKPDLGRSIEDIQDWTHRLVCAKNFDRNILDLVQVPEGMNKNILNDLSIGNNYGDCMLKYINLELQKINEVVKAVAPYVEKEGVSVCIWNIGNYWYPAKLFSRPVNPEDFAEYKMSAATMMGGFSGEYWKLDPESDEEKESYERISFIQQAFNGKEEDLEVSILGVNH